jgi:hypothetical protein
MQPGLTAARKSERSDLTAMTSPIDHPLELAKQNTLGDAFDKFVQVSQCPENMQCLLLVASNLQQIFQSLGEMLRNARDPWPAQPPFVDWPALFKLLLDNRDAICQRNELAGRGLVQVSKRKRKERARPLWPQMSDHPLFALLCMRHETEGMRARYGAFQLQLLYAHWRKLEDFVNAHPGHVGGIRERESDKERDIKLANAAAIALREFQPSTLENSLYKWNTFSEPGKFEDVFASFVPDEPAPRRLHEHIARYLAPGYLPGQGTGGERVRLFESYLNLVDYMGQRFGVRIVSPREDGAHDDAGSLEHVFARQHKARGFPKRRRILDLGLEPLELTGENPTIIARNTGASKRQEGLEAVRARARSFEIDRRLFPWNSQAMRLEDFHRHIRHPLLMLAQGGPAESPSELAAATAIAVAAETGRSFDELMALRVEPNLSSAFAYRPPASGESCGTWKWDAVTPDYRSNPKVDEKLVFEQPKILHFSASKVVTELIARHCSTTPLPDSRLFPYDPRRLRQYVQQWLLRQGNDDRFTPTRISHLAWDLLHAKTGGELASACLTLGKAHPMAQVELFYAALEISEARSLFAHVKEKLWGESVVEDPATYQRLAQSDDEPMLGCRAFPRLQLVRDTVQWLRIGSKEFGKRLSSYDPKSDDDHFLNRAVMYVVWHQFFSFGTRAICDAYQDHKSFSKNSGIGILSDKDFANGYKTRLILAGPRLLGHMEVLEARLAPIADRYFKERKLAPLWLLAPDKLAVDLTPTTIEQVMKEKFPFPVNTPRKVMRYLLRKAGLSHTHTEAFMGHWWHGHEPFSPFSSFDCRVFLDLLRELMPDLIEDTLGFKPVPRVRKR